MARERTVNVFAVLYDSGREGGPAGDGTRIARFRNELEAREFAFGRKVYGQPARVMCADVSRRLAQRWGMA